MPTLLERFRIIEAALDSPARYRDVRLDLTTASGELLLVAGGRWDRTFKRYLDPAKEGDAETRIVIPQQESQLEVIRWGARWIADFRDGFPRDVSVAMLAGDRRGGKTFAGVELVISTCIDAPRAPDGMPLTAWIVAKSYRERFETEQWILQRIPSSWYHHQAAPEHQFIFENGAILRLLSADDPDALKQGRVDIAFVNEPQKIQARAIAHVVLGASDQGGLVILAANPPSDSRGEWMFDVKDAIDDEAIAVAKGKPITPLGIKYFHVDSKKNAAIDQLSRRRAGRIATLIDPSLTSGDVEGAWRRPSDRACWEFDKHKHLHAVPEMGGLLDVTARVAASRGIGAGWDALVGADFQDKPHIVSTVWRCFGDPDDPIFWAVDELAGERKWTEEQYLDAFADQFPAYTNKNTIWVGDASAWWQDSAHSGQRTSSDVFKARNWRMIPPQKARSDKPDAKARNPFVDDQLQCVNDLLSRDRLRIDPNRCPWLAECFREAITKRDSGRRKIYQNKHAHALASALYVLWRMAGKAKRAPGSGGPRGGSFPGSFTSSRSSF